MYIVYGRDNCKYCTKAKKLLLELGLEFEYIDVVICPDSNLEMQRGVLRATGSMARTVPQIFIGDQYVGGYDQLDASLNVEIAAKEVEVSDTDSFQMDL